MKNEKWKMKNEKRKKGLGKREKRKQMECSFLETKSVDQDSTLTPASWHFARYLLINSMASSLAILSAFSVDSPERTEDPKYSKTSIKYSTITICSFSNAKGINPSSNRLLSIICFALTESHSLLFKTPP